MIYILLALLMIAGVFGYFLVKMQRIDFSGKNDKIREFVYDDTLSGEVFTSDIIDDDIDDRFSENDWDDTAYYENDFRENSFELYDDMYD